MKTPVLVVLCGFSSLAVSDTSAVDTPKADSLVERSRLLSTRPETVRPETVRPQTTRPETNHPEKTPTDSGSGAVSLPEKISEPSRFASDSVWSAGQKPPLSLAEIYRTDINAVSYTHLTLPTSREV